MAYTTIKKSTDYFNTKLWTGTGSSNALTGVGFQPDWTWIKNRTDANSHVLQDAVRGVGNTIISNNTDAQSAEGAGDLTAFGSDGFTVGTNGRVNGSGKNMVAWNWKAGTTGSGTSTGSGTGKAYSYSVNTTAGFSIVKYAGNGSAGHTIPHHLGAVSKMIIIKDLSDNESWRVYHGANTTSPQTDYLVLNDATATADDNTVWNDVAPTSSVFTLGTGNPVNNSTHNYIAYCFAEKTGYSKFGSYVGNGNADGTFIYTGFKPAFIMLKNASSAGTNWFMHDVARNPSNPIGYYLTADNSTADQTTELLDIVSNGFKQRNSYANLNSSGDTYIYMAFAEEPLVGDNPATAR